MRACLLPRGCFVARVVIGISFLPNPQHKHPPDARITPPKPTALHSKTEYMTRSTDLRYTSTYTHPQNAFIKNQHISSKRCSRLRNKQIEKNTGRNRNRKTTGGRRFLLTTFTHAERSLTAINEQDAVYKRSNATPQIPSEEKVCGYFISCHTHRHKAVVGRLDFYLFFYLFF